MKVINNMNNFIDKLERRFGRHPIHNLMLYVCILYMIGLVVDLANPTFYQAYLSLNPQAILHGQIWRLVTFLMSPPDTNVFFFIFTLYLYYILGRSLERTWGAFRFNLYYFSGVIFTIIASFIAYFVTGQVFLMDTYYINMSIFFAFAMEYPDMELLFMFLIPIKIKWLAYLDGVLFVISFITGTVGTRIAIAVAMLNFLIYFITVINPAQRYRQHKRRSAYTKAAAARTSRIRSWSSGSARNATAIMNTARIIFLHMNTSNDGRARLDKPCLFPCLWYRFVL